MLMVSGVGPSKVLSNLSILVLSDLPGVGQKMWVCDGQGERLHGCSGFQSEGVTMSSRGLSCASAGAPIVDDLYPAYIAYRRPSMT